MKGLTDIDGILVGHASDFEAVTGCTVILCRRGAVGGVDVRGSATGSQELEALAPGHVTDRVHASAARCLRVPPNLLEPYAGLSLNAPTDFLNLQFPRV